MPKNDLKTPKNEILKVAKNAEKSHFYTEKCHFEVIFSPFQNLFFSLHNPTHYRSKSKKKALSRTAGYNWLSNEPNNFSIGCRVRSEFEK